MGENRDLVSSAETLSTLSPDPTVFRSTLSGLMGVHVSSLFRALNVQLQQSNSYDVDCVIDGVYDHNGLYPSLLLVLDFSLTWGIFLSRPPVRSAGCPSGSRRSLGGRERQRTCAPEAEAEQREERLSHQSIGADHQPRQLKAHTGRNTVFKHRCSPSVIAHYSKMSLLSKLHLQCFSLYQQLPEYHYIRLQMNLLCRMCWINTLILHNKLSGDIALLKSLSCNHLGQIMSETVWFILPGASERRWKSQKKPHPIPHSGWRKKKAFFKFHLTQICFE